MSYDTLASSYPQWVLHSRWRRRPCRSGSVSDGQEDLWWVWIELYRRWKGRKFQVRA